MATSKPILVIGDSCTDVFVYGHANRLCPDYPVPVFVAEQTTETGGMAWNVAKNIKSLGMQIMLITNDALVTKTRYVDMKTNHMFLRVDTGEEKIERCPREVLHKIAFETYSAVVISDYNKGLLLEEDIEYIASKHPIVFLDTKKLLGSWYHKVPYIKINESEFERTRHLLTNTNNIILTAGSRGCYHKGVNYPVEKVEIKDAVGAGDTFLAGLAVKFVETGDIEAAIKFGNMCATEVVQKRGVYVVSSKSTAKFEPVLRVLSNPSPKPVE